MKSIKFKPKFEIGGLRKWEFKNNLAFKKAQLQLKKGDSFGCGGIYFNAIEGRSDIVLCLWTRDKKSYIFEVSKSEIDNNQKRWSPIFDENFLDGDKEFS